MLPLELIFDLKSIISNRDLFYLELTCCSVYSVDISQYEKRLRKCRIWKDPEHFVSKLRRSMTYHPKTFGFQQSCCFHITCWQYASSHVKVEDVRLNNFFILRGCAELGHYELLQFICTTFELRPQDIRSSHNFALRWAARNGHLSIVKYLCEHYSLDSEDVQAGNNWALRWAFHKEHHDVVEYLSARYNIHMVKYVRLANYI